MTVAESTLVVTESLTVKVKVWVEVVERLSVTVIVSRVAARVPVGVPEIRPVAELSVKPAGRAGEME